MQIIWLCVTCSILGMSKDHANELIHKCSMLTSVFWMSLTFNFTNIPPYRQRWWKLQKGLPAWDQPHEEDWLPCQCCEHAWMLYATGPCVLGGGTSAPWWPADLLTGYQAQHYRGEILTYLFETASIDCINLNGQMGEIKTRANKTFSTVL